MKEEQKQEPWNVVIIKLVLVVLSIVVIMVWLMAVPGCQPQRRVDLTPETEAGKLDALKTDKIIEKIYETNLLISGFIVVAAIGVFCCFSRQIQLGLALIATGGAGIWITRADQSLAQNQWLLLIPTGLLVVGGAIWVFKNEQIRTALKQIVRGVDKMKQTGTPDYETFKRYQRAGEGVWEGQSKPTEKIVRDIKAKL